MIEIKNIQGETIFTTSVNEGSIYRKKLMSEDYILLKFSTEAPVHFDRGCYIVHNGLRYEVVDLTYPTYNASTGGYDYELRLDIYYWKWKNKNLFYDRQGNQEASWHLTRTPDAHLSVVCSNLSSLGYNYNGSEFTYSIGESVDASAKLVSYDSTNIIDALTLIAETWDAEWWIEDNVIHLGRCEYNTAIDFEQHHNVQTMSRSESNDNFATRIYAFGSTRNLPVNYRENNGVVVEGVVQKRLMLPTDTPFVDAYPDMQQEQAVEAVVIFDDVYPRRIGTMSNITTKEYIDAIENADGSTTEEKWNAYRYKDGGLTFLEKYVIPGEELRIVFTSGALNGMDFAVTFNPDGKSETESGAQLWEIVRSEDYGIALPNDSLKPVVGDTYILYGFDTSFVSDTYLPAAELELKQRAEQYVEKSKEDPSVYDCKMNTVAMIEDGIELNIGDRVQLLNPAYFDEGGRQSRVYGFEKYLDGSQVSYTVGNTAKYSRLANVENELKEIVYQGNAYSGSGSGVYVIGEYDKTTPSDRNVFSSLRNVKEIESRALSRLYADIAGGHITFKEGFTAEDFAIFYKGVVKEYLSSEIFIPGLLGEGFKIYDDNGKWTAEFDNVVVRQAMTIYELIVSKIRAVNGGLVVSPANGRIKSVTKTEGPPTYYVLGIEGDMQFAVGDLIRCQVYSSNLAQFYWVEIKEVDGDSIFCLESDFNGAVPTVGDDLIQMGNTSNTARQAVVYITASVDGKPRIQILDGINTTTLTGKNKTTLGCLDGITDSDFPAEYQPQGYGLWSENAFLKGVFLLRSGKTVEQEINSVQTELKTELSAVPGQITAAVSGVKTDVSALTTRVSSAEAKITPDAIKLTVQEQTTSIASDASLIGKGQMIYRDPIFQSGNNSMNIYNNAGNGTVGLSRVSGITGNPNGSGYCIKMVTTGTPSPSWGGFYFGTSTKANQVLVTRIIAKIPVGRQINWHSNATGTGSASKWLTSQAGTGDWTEYVFKLICGASGTFSSTNFFALSGGSTPTASAPLEWYVAYATVFDATGVDDTPTRSEIKGGITITSGAINIFGTEISLAGAVTFTSLASDAQTKINTAQTSANNAATTASTAQTTANTAKTNAATAQTSANNAASAASAAQTTANTANSGLTTLKNSLKGLAYLDAVSLAKLDSTIVEGGYIKTSLINVNTLVAKHIDSATGTLSTLTMKSGGYIDLPPTFSSNQKGRLDQSGLKLIYSGGSSQMISWYGSLGTYAGKITCNNSRLVLTSDYGVDINNEFIGGSINIGTSSFTNVNIGNSSGVLNINSNLLTGLPMCVSMYNTASMTAAGNHAITMDTGLLILTAVGSSANIYKITHNKAVNGSRITILNATIEKPRIYSIDNVSGSNIRYKSSGTSFRMMGYSHVDLIYYGGYWYLSTDWGQ